MSTQGLDTLIRASALEKIAEVGVHSQTGFGHSFRLVALLDGEMAEATADA